MACTRPFASTLRVTSGAGFFTLERRPRRGIAQHGGLLEAPYFAFTQQRDGCFSGRARHLMQAARVVEVIALDAGQLCCQELPGNDRRDRRKPFRSALRQV